MKRNVGRADQIIRFVVGPLLMYVGFFDNPVVSGGMFKVALGVLGAVAFLAGVFRVCPMYWLGGIDTTGMKTG